MMMEASDYAIVRTIIDTIVARSAMSIVDEQPI